MEARGGREIEVCIDVSLRTEAPEWMGWSESEIERCVREKIEAQRECCVSVCPDGDYVKCCFLGSSENFDLSLIESAGESDGNEK